MITLIKTELIKLKRSYMFLMCIGGSVCAPLLIWFVFLNKKHRTGISPDFYEYMTQINMLIAIIIGTLLYGLFATYVFEREFKEDMYKHLFTVPVKKINLLISKVVVIMIGLLLLTLTSFIFGIIFSLISGFLNINPANITNTLILFLKAYLSFIPLMIPVILVTIIFKGFVAPIAFSIIAEIILFIVMQSKYIALYPWSAPILMGTDLVNREGVVFLGSVNGNLLLAGLVGVMAFIACLLFMKQKEIV